MNYCILIGVSADILFIISTEVRVQLEYNSSTSPVLIKSYTDINS